MEREQAVVCHVVLQGFAVALDEINEPCPRFVGAGEIALLVRPPRGRPYLLFCVAL
jgi:hypothetical protein